MLEKYVFMSPSDFTYEMINEAKQACLECKPFYERVQIKEQELTMMVVQAEQHHKKIAAKGKGKGAVGN